REPGQSRSWDVAPREEAAGRGTAAAQAAGRHGGRGRRYGREAENGDGEGAEARPGAEARRREGAKAHHDRLGQAREEAREGLGRSVRELADDRALVRARSFARPSVVRRSRYARRRATRGGPSPRSGCW